MMNRHFAGLSIFQNGGIGPTTVEKIRVIAEENGISIWDVVKNAPHFLGGRAATTVGNFATLIKSFKIDVKEKDAYEAAANIAKQSGILRELYEDKTIEGLNRYENVQEAAQCNKRIC